MKSVIILNNIILFYSIILGCQLDKSPQKINDVICSMHNEDCQSIAKKLKLNIDQYHNVINEFELLKSIQEEANSTDANGDIVGPDDNNTSSENLNNTNLENYEIDDAGFNSWQCKRCGQLSRSTEQPSGGDFGSCKDEYKHSWNKANTNHGYQCTRCGIENFLIDHMNESIMASGGEFGKCQGGNDHRWNKF